ncbi:MAG: putative cytochrome c oxidase subunit I [Gallionellaceae bacterium]|nr:MAG: putative cytochrome c oxidase subunit I [Gallionellaceae bacterium]
MADIDEARNYAGASPDAGGPFVLPTPHPDNQKLAAGWLWLSFAALVGAGLFALFVVLARTPYVSDLFPTVDFFRSALVVHVDLSVLVWFFAFAGVLWSAASPPKLMPLGWIALLLAVAGILVVMLSPFVGAGGPIMNNYIPVLENKMFLTGLFLFGCSVGLLALRGLLTVPLTGFGPGREGGVLCFGLATAAFATVMALVAFAWAFATIPFFVKGLPYFEALFWGGGHVMQFSYTLLMMVGWLWLAAEYGARITMTPRIALAMFALGVAPVLLTPLIYSSYETNTSANMEMFITMMKAGGGLAVVPVGLAVMVAMWKHGYPDPEMGPLFGHLISSLILFAVGGGISFLIKDSNTIITAHYHGTGGGVSLSFMGMSLVLLHKLGYKVVNFKLALWMPYVYCVGQLMHIIGLLWSGGYGVQRKVAGADQGLQSFSQIAGMGLMGVGGLIAVVGGIMFLVVIYRALKERGTGGTR